MSGPTQGEDESEEQDSSEELDDFWVAQVDGSWNFAGSGASLLLLGSERFVVEYILRFNFSVTNNGAKYKALITRLRIASKLKV